MLTKRAGLKLATALAALMVVGSAQAAEKLRLLTWADYVPKDVMEQFTKETGIEVEVTLSNNEEMISKLRATQGAGFDLVQPSQDRIAGPQAEFGIYKPLDLSKVKSDQFIASMLEATKKNTTVDGKVYGVPHIWGTDGLIVNTKTAPKVADYGDLCSDAGGGKVSFRAKRPALIAFAFANGMDPFASYNDLKGYAAMMEKVGAKLAECKKNVKFFWDGKDQLLNAIRSGEVVAAMAWDTGGWKLNSENADIKFIAPKSGALGWVDTFAIPAKGRNDDAAYTWINFNMKPEIAAKVAATAGNFTASNGADKLMQGKLKEQFAESFPKAAIDNIKWYPAVPAGIEEIEGKVLDRLKAGS
ncbi:extracellular solute-binding protein [Microvirga sp. 3-52]|uniref:extracellular solute-binding protein n=1 Tax=Microvirga sp. 3-52 TaxID=2792425 RepID=UPI001ACDF8F3|nr:extracellular solute-binding protein [Microvirga sp. 3-52]MBO1905507.1 extracellular solute-binding protein [Microvirga sp. 3-52]MBS7452761.1 extracellular solute-binding protein [Microvirga sp. 3-52]